MFTPDLRRSVIFGRNDLTSDAPISRIDMRLCRNTLRYLNAETQNRVVGRLGFCASAGRSAGYSGGASSSGGWLDQARTDARRGI
ncbi:MAG TPA: CheR family methyltransferase, partial [Propionibacteriaceae bacterium]|nr:CheR family methyltransferase [Propionibacteriaceae bacterium]